MSDLELQRIAENASFIVSGYAFTKLENGFISILNLEHPECAMVITDECEIVQTNMDEIEQRIVIELCRKNLQFLEV